MNETFLQSKPANAALRSIRIAPAEGEQDDTLVLGLNGRMYQLRRGVPVDNVPAPLLEILRHADIGFAVLA